MSILKRAIYEQTGIRKPAKSKLVIISMDVEKTGDIEPMGIATKEEYKMELKLSSYFWCNRAQYKDAVKLAEKAVLSELLSPILSVSARLRKAAMDEDYKEVFRLADELSEECGINN